MKWSSTDQSWIYRLSRYLSSSLLDRTHRSGGSASTSNQPARLTIPFLFFFFFFSLLAAALTIPRKTSVLPRKPSARTLVFPARISGTRGQNCRRTFWRLELSLLYNGSENVRTRYNKATELIRYHSLAYELFSRVGGMASVYNFSMGLCIFLQCSDYILY